MDPYGASGVLDGLWIIKIEKSKMEVEVLLTIFPNGVGSKLREENLH